MLIYNGPIGDAVENPDEKFIEDIVFNKGEEYWKQGSGDSCFEIEGCDEWLIFFYDEPFGFFIMRHPDYLVPMDESIKIETVQHLVGGEPMNIPTCSYVSRETAYKIIKTYIDTEEIDDSINWVDLYDIDFDFDF